MRFLLRYFDRTGASGAAADARKLSRPTSSRNGVEQPADRGLVRVGRAELAEVGERQASPDRGGLDEARDLARTTGLDSARDDRGR